MPTFEIHWLDEDGKTIDFYSVIKNSRQDALRAASLRIKQSFHLVPEETSGLMIRPERSLQERIESL